jgi:hypothetical protein
MSSKKFEFSITTTDGKMIVTETIELGSKEKTFPDNWKTDPMTLLAIEDLKKEILKRYIKIEYNEVV